MLTGECPEVNPCRRRLRDWGHDDFTSYVRLGLRGGARARDPPAHEHRRRKPRGLRAAREVTASQGLMLESVSERLMETVHAGSPTKHPRVRLDAIAAAGELRIPFTSGILVGIGESEEDRVASLEALAELQRRHGHIQELILQNFVPHPRYYGAEVADIAAEASERQWAGTQTGGSRQQHRAARLGLAGDAGGDDAARRRVPAADAGGRRPGAAEPLRLVARPRRGGRHRPRRPLRQRRPHLARASLPEPASGPQAASSPRLRADRTALRLPAVHERGVARSRRPRRAASDPDLPPRGFVSGSGNGARRSARRPGPPRRRARARGTRAERRGG